VATGEDYDHQRRPDRERRETPAPALLVAIPTVKTNKNMPMNSTMSFRLSE
jgi:hypothetical protein